MASRRFGSAESLRMEICENLAYVNASVDMARMGAPAGSSAHDTFTQALFKALLSLPQDRLEETCSKVLDLVEEQGKAGKAPTEGDSKRKIHIEIIVKRVEIFLLKAPSGVLTKETLGEVKSLIEANAAKYGISVNQTCLASLNGFVGADIQQNERAKAEFMETVSSLFSTNK